MKKQLFFCGLSIGLLAFTLDAPSVSIQPTTTQSTAEYDANQEQKLATDVPSLIKSYCLKLNRTAFENNWKDGSSDNSLDECIASKTKNLPLIAQQIGKPEKEALQYAQKCLRKKDETEVQTCMFPKQEKP